MYEFYNCKYRDKEMHMITLSLSKDEVDSRVWEILVGDTLGYPWGDVHSKCCYIEIDIEAFRDKTKELERVYVRSIELPKGAES